MVIDPQYYRPAEVDVLLADASKARAKLGWRPEMPFDDLVRMMVDADLAAVSAQTPTTLKLKRPSAA